MKKAWSFFWLVVASATAVIVLYAILEPYIPWIIFIAVFALLLFLAVFIYRKIKLRRRFF